MTEAPPDTGNEPAPTPDPPAPSDTPDPAEEIAKWQALARKHEDRAKANAAAAKELEQVKAASMSEQEKAVAEAVAKARTETLVEVGGQLAAAQVRVAAAGRLADDQLDTLIETVDLAKFLTEDGAVDTERVKTFVDRIAPASDAPEPDPFSGLDLGQGARGAPAAGGEPRDQFARFMSTQLSNQ